MSNNRAYTNRRELIKYQLRIRGTSLAEIGRELGVSMATMSQVSLGTRTSERVLAAISEKLCLPVKNPASTEASETGVDQMMR